MNLTDWSTINEQSFNFHAAGASVCSGRELSDELTEPRSASSSRIICIEATVLLLPRRAASLTNALVTLARTTLELALLSHQANLVFFPSAQSMLPLLLPAVSLGANGLNRTCSLSRVHPTLSCH